LAFTVDLTAGQRVDRKVSHQEKHYERNCGTIFAPSSQIIDKARGLIDRVLEHNGGNLLFGRSQRAILREVGFVRIEASASYDSYGTPETAQDSGEYLAELILQPHMTNVIIEQKWASQSELEEMSTAFKAWGKHPDAFYARARCEAVGWKE
jgi:hypothetical protein